MNSNKKTIYTPNATLVPVPTAGKEDLTKWSPPLDVKSTVSNPSDQDPKIILVSVPRNTPIPDPTNTPVEPTEVFKTIVYNITEALLFLIAPISYEPETVLLHLEDLKQELSDATATYKSAAPHPKKLLLAINVPIKIPTGPLQYHQTHSSISLNLNPDLKAEATIKNHHSHKSKNHMADGIDDNYSFSVTTESG